MLSKREKASCPELTSKSHPTRNVAINFIVYLFFFLSGAFALIYEIAWTRTLTLEFGSTTLAVSTVLTIFMGGLALGARLSGKWADKQSRPLRAYALIELAIAVYALLSPFTFRWFLPLFTWLGSGVAESVWLLNGLRFLLSAILLLPPTILMGSTLPVLSRFFANQDKDYQKSAGILYGMNTVGAFVGALSAEFLWLPKLGLFNTVMFVAIGNLLLGAAACFIGRKTSAQRESVAPSSADAEQALGKREYFILVAVALTGAAAMMCEVAWSRVLVLILGGSVYSYTIVISTFLAGLGLGAWWIALLVNRWPRHATTLFYLLAIASAIFVCIGSAMFAQLPTLFILLFKIWKLVNQFMSWDVNNHGQGFFWIQVFIAALVMFGPALLMGGLFSTALRICHSTPEFAGKQIGRLYAWNTLGSILGSFATGFFLIPAFGMRNAILVAATLQCVGGALILFTKGGRMNLIGAAASIGIIVAILNLTPPWHRQLMTSGMFQYASSYELTSWREFNARLEKDEELLYYREGLAATVTVTRDRRTKNDYRYIYTNGKIDGSTHYDMPTQRLAAHLPLLLHENPKQVCVIGMGTGSTAGSATLHPVERVKTVEIEAAMVEGARFFKEHNHNIHENPKADILVTDGRLFLALNPQAFDVIISEPSNPWLAGPSDLFTTELFKSAVKSLRPGGLYCQWVQLYGMDTKNVRILISTFASVFPNVYVASPILDTDLLLIGSQNPIPINPDQIAERMKRPEIASDLADKRLGIQSVQDLLARFRFGPAEVKNLFRTKPLHTDDLPIIAYEAPKNLYLSTRKENMDFLAKHAIGITPYLDMGNKTAEDRLVFFRTLKTAYRKHVKTGGETAELDRWIDAAARARTGGN